MANKWPVTEDKSFAIKSTCPPKSPITNLLLLHCMTDIFEEKNHSQGSPVAAMLESY